MRWLRRIVAAQPRWVVAVLAVLFVAGTVRFFTAERKDKTPEMRIGADGRYHWAYLTSLVLDGDLDFANQYDDPESGNYYHYGPTDTGRLANPFPVGPALAWAPLFVAAHGVARLTKPEHWETGNSLLHQRVTLYGSFVMAFAAGLLAYAMARRRDGPVPALAGAVAAVGGGSLLYYALYLPSFAHAPSALAVAALLYLWERGRGARTLGGWLGLGALLGAAMLMRTQNIAFAAPLVVEGAALVVSAARARGARAAVRALGGPLAGAAAALVVFLPQMLCWKVLYGSALSVPQGEGYMRWTEPLWSETIFSSRNGLLPYAPLWALGALGLLLVTRRDWRLGAALFGTFFLTAYLNGASSDWSGGGAFGGRRYDGMIVHVTLGLAALVRVTIDGFERRPRLAGGLVVAVVVAMGVTLNYLMAEDFRAGRVPRSASKDMLATYDKAFMRGGRKLWETGNPLSWPAAWVFALRTGASPERYDLVVGTFFLTDFRLEAFRRPNDRMRDELRFADGKYERFLVDGLGDAVADGRPVKGTRARFLVPLNHAGGVAFQLRGRATAATPIAVSWNGTRVAAADVRGDALFSLEFALDAEARKRGVNVVEVEVGSPGVIVLDKLVMQERP